MLNVENFDWPSFLLGLVTAVNIITFGLGLVMREWLFRLHREAQEDAERRVDEAKKLGRLGR